MEPIISPWFIYFLTLISPITCLSVVLLVLCMIFFVIMLITYSESNEKDKAKLSSAFKRFRLLAIICTFLTLTIIIFLPNEKQIVTIYASTLVTKDNVNKSVDVIKNVFEEGKKELKGAKNEAVNDLVRIIEAIRGETKKAR